METNKTRGRPRDNERADMMKWLYDYGFSLKQIGDRFGCSKENVRQVFLLRGWVRRQFRA